MDLLIEDVADLLKISAETVACWAKEGRIPSYEISNQVRFNPEEIERWMIQSDLSPFDHNGDKSTGINQFILFRALHRGQVYQNIPGTTKQEVIKETLLRLADPLEFDAEGVTEMFLERERLMPTAINNGVAVPHTREFKLATHYDAVAVVFPEKPLEYEALDGAPVHTLFFLFSCDDRRHLSLLAKLAHLAGQEEGQKILQNRPSKPELLDFVRCWEKEL
jgi:PTS system nitrogen regulatory IIA component